MPGQLKLQVADPAGQLFFTRQLLDLKSKINGKYLTYNFGDAYRKGLYELLEEPDVHYSGG